MGTFVDVHTALFIFSGQHKAGRAVPARVTPVEIVTRAVRSTDET